MARAPFEGPMIVIGDESDAGRLEFRLGGVAGEFRYPIRCPGERAHERHHHFTKNGHDTSVKGNPQQFRCQTCKASFYPHTSAFFRALWDDLKTELRRAWRVAIST